MALKVGELYAEISLKTNEFDRGVDQSGNKFQGLASSVKTGTTAMATAFTAVVGGASAMAAAAFRVGKDYNVLQQTSRAALTTLLGSAEAANAQMDKLDDFARNSPFAKQVFISAQQQLIGFGRSAESVLPTLDAVQNAVAATGGSNQQITELVGIIAKVGASGKLTAQDLMEFGNRGVDAATLIGSQMGKTGAEIREQITAGTLGADDAIQALTDGMTARFGGATDNIKQQWVGATDRIKGAWRDVGSIIAAPFIDPMGGGRAVVWANEVADTLRNLQTKIGPLADAVVKRLGGAFDKVSPTIKTVSDAINGWDISKINGQIDTLVKYGPQIAGVTSGLLAMGGNALGLQRLGLSLNPVVAGVAALVAASPELRGAASEMLRGLEPLIPVAGQLGGALLQASDEVLHGLAPALVELINAATPVVVALAEGLTPAVVGVVSSAGPLVDILASVADVVADIPGPVLGAVGAFAAMWALSGPARGWFDTLGNGFKTVVDQMRVQQALSGSTAGGMGLIGAAGVTASRGIKAVGDSLKAAFITNPVGLIILAVATALGVLVAAQQKSKQKAQDHADQIQRLSDALRDANGEIDSNVRRLAAKELADTKMANSDKNMLQAAKDMGLGLRDVNEAWLGNEDALARVEAKLAGVKAETFTMIGQHGQVITVQTDAARAAKALSEELQGGSDRMREAQEANRLLAEAQGIATGTAEEQRNALIELNNAIKENSASNISQKEAQIRQTEAQIAANAAITNGVAVQRDANGAVDEYNDLSIQADKALLALVNSNNGLTGAMEKNNATADQLNGTIRTQRADFINTATQMGYTQTEAENLANAYGLIPNRVETYVDVDTAEAHRKMKAVKDEIFGVQGLYVKYPFQGTSSSTGDLMRKANGGLVEYFARGGIRESHVAEIAPAGTTRVWNEPETGGEGYVPLALSKRARSLQVMDEIARRFGYVMVEAGSTQGTDGGKTITNSSKRTLNYYAAPGAPSLTAEDALYDALGRDDEGGW